MEATEIVVPLIKEDFEDGDRVFSMFHGNLTKGTVVKSRFTKTDSIVVNMDNGGGQISVHLSCFVRGMGIEYWGKIPDLSRIREGTVLSRLEADGSRRAITVKSHIPGHSIQLNVTPFPGGTYGYRVADGIILEDKLIDWEIEE